MSSPKPLKQTDNLKDAVDQLLKKYGDNAITLLTSFTEVPCIPTGLPNLDYIIGQPGLPRGKITQIYGREQTGKSLVAETIAAAVQKSGGTTLYIDFETSLHPDWLRTIGIELGPTFLVSTPDYLEDGFNICNHLVSTGKVDLVILDSVGAMLPKETAVRDAADARPGWLARPLSIALNQFLPILKNSPAACIIINHIRAKINTGWSVGPSETMAGGNALRFYTHVLIKLRRRQLIKASGGYSGLEIVARCEKNKVGVPYKETALRIVFDEGFDASASLADMLEEAGIVTVGSTGWVKSEALDLKLRGRDNFCDLLRNDTELQAKAAAALAEYSPEPPLIETIEIGEPE